MGEEFSAGTLSADLTVDATQLNKGVDDATDGFDRLERKLDELIGVMKNGFNAATGAAKETEEQVHHTHDALHELKEAAEAIGLYEAFERAKEMAMESVNAFDANNRAFMAMSASVNELDTEKFKELAEQLSLTSRNSLATEESTIALASRFGLADSSIAAMLPQLNQFAFLTGQDLPGAMQRFAIAVASGEVSPRRLGLALDEQQRAAFKAGTETERVGILAEAMSRKTEGAGGEVKTAADAINQFHKANEEALVAVGGMMDKPIADFFNALAHAVQACTSLFNDMNPMLKELLGYISAAAIGLTTFSLGFGALYKTFGLVMPLVTSFVGALPTMAAGVSSVAAAFIPFVVPVLAAVSALLTLGTVWGMVRNALDNKDLPDNFGQLLKEGAIRAKDDVLSLFGDLKEQVAEAAEGVEKEGEEGFQGAEGAAGKRLDFGSDASTGGRGGALGLQIEDVTTAWKKSLDEETQARADATEMTVKGLDSFEKSLSDSVDQAEQAGQFSQAMTDAFAKAADKYNKEADEEEARAADQEAEHDRRQQEQATERVNQMYESAGGNYLAAMAGVNADDTDDTKKEKYDSLSDGQRVGGAVAGSISQAAGPAGQVAGGLVSGAMGNPMGFVQAGMALLTQSKSFQTIMMLINKTLSVLVQAINPILNAVIPALTVVLSIVGDVVKDIIKNLTPLMAPIMKLITTIMLIVKPFINIFMQLSTILVPILDKLIVPVLNALSTALMFVAKIVIEGVVNPLIEAWNGIIDAIDDVLGWLDIDLSSLKLHTVSLEDDADAVDSVTNSMNQLDQSSQNIPEGYKVALSAFNAYGGAPPPATATNPLASALQSALAPFKGMSTGAAVTAVGNSMDFMTQYNKAQGSNVNMMNMYGNTNYNNALKAYGEGDTSAATQTAQQVAAYLSSHSASATMSNKMALPTTSSAVSGATTNNASNSSVVVQNVSVQATSADLIGQMMKTLKNQGYLKSGTNLMGATQRTQYGAA